MSKQKKGTIVETPYADNLPNEGCECYLWCVGATITWYKEGELFDVRGDEYINEGANYDGNMVV